MADYTNVTNFYYEVVTNQNKIIPLLDLSNISNNNFLYDEDFLGDVMINPSFNGDGRIFGYTTINGVPKRLGVILKSKDNYIVDSQFSRASDGWFEFQNLNRNISYTILVRDPSNQFDDQYRYNVSPVI